MSDSNFLASVEKDGSRSFEFETDSSSNSLDISDQITIQNFTYEGEDQFVKESNENKQWMQSETDKLKEKDRDLKHIRNETSEKQLVESEELESDGEMWTEDEQIPMLRVEEDDEEDSPPIMEENLNKENPVTLEQDVEENKLLNDKMANTEEPMKVQNSLQLDASDCTKLTEGIVKWTKVDTADSELCATSSHKIDEVEKSEASNSLNKKTRISMNTCDDIGVDVDRTDVQVSLALDEKEQISECTNNTAHEDTNRNADTSVVEGTVTDDDNRQCEIPDTTTYDYDHDSSDRVCNIMDEEVIVQNTIESSQKNKVQNEIIVWDNDANATEWDASLFDSEMKEKTGQEDGLAEYESQEENCANIQKTDVNSTSKDLDKDFSPVNTSSDMRSEETDALSENIENEGQTNALPDSISNDNEQTIQDIADQGDQYASSIGYTKNNKRISCKKEIMSEDEVDSQEDQNIVVKTRIEMETDKTAKYNDHSCSTRADLGLKRKNEHLAIGPVKKRMKNIERVKQKLEEIIRKSRIEEDIAIAELQQMKQEKAEILKSITAEMEIVKSLLVQRKGKGLKKEA